MALLKLAKTDKVEILPRNHNIIQVREVVEIQEDGEVVSEKFHRRVLPPGRIFQVNDTDYYQPTSIEEEGAEVTALAALWSNSVHTEYFKYLLGVETLTNAQAKNLANILA